MKEYEFVTIENQRMIGAAFDGYREIIREYARQGYTYVGIVPAEIVGILQRFDLVFEKDV